MFFFVENRCTDPVNVEAQFDVTFSSDEEVMADAKSKATAAAEASQEEPAS